MTPNASPDLSDVLCLGCGTEFPTHASWCPICGPRSPAGERRCSECDWTVIDDDESVCLTCLTPGPVLLMERDYETSRAVDNYCG